MKQVVMRKCQIRNERGQIILYEPGMVIDHLDKPHIHCRVIEEEFDSDYKIDFLKAGKEELEEAEWSIAEAKEAIFDAYEVKIKGKDKDKVIEQILDARYRAADLAATKV